MPLTPPACSPFRLRLLLIAGSLLLPATAGRAADPFVDTVKPFLATYCVKCHDAETKSGELTLAKFDSATKLLDDFRQWEHVVTFLKKEEMPPKKAKLQPTAGE